MEEDTPGARVRALRQERGINQKTFAEAVGLGPSYLSKIETGDKNGSVDVWLKLATALGTTVEELFGVDAAPAAASDEQAIPVEGHINAEGLAIGHHTALLAMPGALTRGQPPIITEWVTPIVDEVDETWWAMVMQAPIGDFLPGDRIAFEPTSEPEDGKWIIACDPDAVYIRFAPCKFVDNRPHLWPLGAIGELVDLRQAHWRVIAVARHLWRAL